MEEQLISLETAKLAKEKGFDWEVRAVYAFAVWHDNKVKLFKEPLNIDKDEDWLAPTQALLAKWLREVHNINPEVRSTRNSEGLVYTVLVNGIKDGGYFCEFLKEDIHPSLFTPTLFDTYEKALEAGLIHALNLI